MLELPLETHKEYNPWQFILEEKNLIKLANSKYSLADFFDKKSIQFSECYSPSGWNKKTSCIFPDHRDSTPSFHFNETDNIFHCFGCTRAGGIVQLISYLENRSLEEVAFSLLKKSDFDCISEQIENENIFSIKHILFDFANVYNKFCILNNNPKQIQYADNISAVFDYHIRSSIKNKVFNKEQIEAIYQIFKKKLELYGNTDCR